MDNWEKFNETSLPETEGFFNQLNMKDITDANYSHTKRICKDFEIKNYREYHDLYVQSDTDLLTDIDMLLMVEKGIRGGICHSIYQYAKASNKYMKDYAHQESSYFQYCGVNNLYGWAMSQKIPVNNFEWIEDTSQFNEDFIKSYDEESDKGYFLEVDAHELHYDLPFLPERMETEKVKKLVANLYDKTE